MPYHEVKDPFQTAQNVLFDKIRKWDNERVREKERQDNIQSTQEYLSQQVRDFNEGANDTYPSYGSQETNNNVKDSMNEKLEGKGITVDNVDTKHVSDDTQEMTLANRPSTDDKVQANMNDKLNDKGIKVDNVNTDPMKNVEHVSMDRKESTTSNTGVGTATTSGTEVKKLSTKQTSPLNDSPLDDMERGATSSTPKSNVRSTNETSARAETKISSSPSTKESKTSMSKVSAEPKAMSVETNTKSSKRIFKK